MTPTVFGWQPQPVCRNCPPLTSLQDNLMPQLSFTKKIKNYIIKTSLPRDTQSMLKTASIIFSENYFGTTCGLSSPDDFTLVLSHGQAPCRRVTASCLTANLWQCKSRLPGYQVMNTPSDRNGRKAYCRVAKKFEWSTWSTQDCPTMHSACLDFQKRDVNPSSLCSHRWPMPVAADRGNTIPNTEGATITTSSLQRVS